MRRTLVIVFIGVLLNACGSLLHGGIHSLDSLRYMGVLQRLGLCYGIPVNKKVWSPTFVLVTCGAAMSLLSLMMWTLDGNIWRHSGFFSVFGTNSLFIYVLSDLLGIFDVSGLIYSLLSAFLPFKFASLCAALLFLLVCYLVALPLYRKHIYIRI